MNKSVLVALAFCIGSVALQSRAEVPDQTVIVSTDRYNVTAADVKNFLSSSISVATSADVSIEQVDSIEDKAMDVLQGAAKVFNGVASLFRSQDTAFVGAVITIKARARWDLDENHNPKQYGEDKAPPAELLTCNLLVEYNLKGVVPKKSDMISFDCRNHSHPNSMFTLHGNVNPKPLHTYVPAAILVNKK